MNYRKAVAEGKRLLKRSEEDQWALAKLTAEVLASGAKARTWASDLGVSPSHVSTLKTLWGRYGVSGQKRPKGRAFAELYQMAKVSEGEADNLLALAEETGRSVTTVQRSMRYGDKVETARRLLADPEVAADVMRDDRTRRQASKATERVAQEMVRESEARDRQRYPRETADRDVLAVVSYINDADERVKAALRVIRDGFEVTAEWRPALLDATERLENTIGWLRTVVESKHRTTDDALDAMLRGER